MRTLLITLLFIGSTICAPQRRQDHYKDDEYDRPQQPQQSQQYQQQQFEPRPKGETTTFIPIIRFEKEQGDDGAYKTTWETGNNILAQEEGYLKSLGPDPDSPEGAPLNAQVQQGSYTYTSPEGQVITVTYTADEKGFHAVGDHLPTPPPVSPEVQKGLDLIYAAIKAQQEQAAVEDKHNPQGRRENQINNDFNGQYRQK
ncbi:endocuticle structural glycoprotein SgAbd-8 [Onthophagus taurus]|uniref:endocuticle structural glycoprotein SgAbd-8 n=1 Tax=Onthophagus taurus TaxID=166361 RepID=UPI000C204EFF|nr:endocuticle structural glycoprotein SgAbd-8 [Onthophagus taurus]